jgi:hypothetical protein
VNNLELFQELGSSISLLKQLDLAALSGIDEQLALKLNVSAFTGHGHEIAEINELAQILATKLEAAALTPINEAIAGKAATDHTHSGYALTDHTHPMSEVDGLTEALGNKQPSGSYAAADHGHGINAIAGLTEALGGKAASSHDHTIGQVNGLQAALDGKMDDSQFVVLTQAAYTALATKDPNTFYFIPEA